MVLGHLLVVVRSVHETVTARVTYDFLSIMPLQFDWTQHLVEGSAALDIVELSALF